MEALRKTAGIVKNIICWGITIFLVLMALGGFPSVASLFFLFAAVLFIPVRAVKNFFSTFIPIRWMKVGFAVILFCIACLIYPLSNVPNETDTPNKTTISETISETDTSVIALRAEPETDLPITETEFLITETESEAAMETETLDETELNSETESDEDKKGFLGVIAGFMSALTEKSKTEPQTQQPETETETQFEETKPEETESSETIPTVQETAAPETEPVPTETTPPKTEIHKTAPTETVHPDTEPGTSAPIVLPIIEPTESKTAQEPAEQDPKNTTVYVLNTNTKKIHYQSCSSVRDIKEKNYATTTNYAQAIADGYIPCKRCNP